MSGVSAPIRPYVPFFPSSMPALFSIRYNGKKHELNSWQKTAILITGLVGTFLAGVGVLLGFCLSYYFRNRLMDQLIAQPLSTELEGIDFYFDADYFPDTNKETVAPVSATELFYQQKQIAKFCSIHSLCNFAGRNIDQLVPKLIQTNNEYWCDNFQKNWQMTPVRALESVRRTGLYIEPSLQAIADRGGVHQEAVREYMKHNKSSLNLPESCEIQTVAGSLDSDQIKTAVNKIQTDSHLHRVMVSVENTRYAHLSAIRKDDAGQWRVLDSIQNIFVSRSQLQPSFPTLQEAVDNLTKRHRGHNNSIHLIYPSQDTPGTALKIMQKPALSSSTVANEPYLNVG